MSTETAASRNLATCHLCWKLAPTELHHCPRCGSTMHLRKSDSIQRTLALLITACVLYIPANIYPIMYTDQLGSTEPSTIIGGVILLIKLGSVPVAAVIDLGNGVEGTLRASELSRDRVEDARVVLKPGAEIEAKFTGVDRKNRTITLSVKAKENKVMLLLSVMPLSAAVNLGARAISLGIAPKDQAIEL